MVVISQTLEIVIGLAILILLVMLFFSIFGTPECNAFANTTAVDLKRAIDKVALEDGVAPWPGDDIPPDEKTEYYTAVQIRLCEKSAGLVGAAFMGHTPTYELVYETFPQEGGAWTESMPFGGGAMSSLMFYGILKLAPKALTIGRTLAGWGSTLIKGTVKILNPLEWLTHIGRLRRLYDYIRKSRVVKWISKAFHSASSLKSVKDDVPDRLNDRYFSRKWKNLVTSVKNSRLKDKLEEVEAFIKEGIIKGELDEASNTYKPYWKYIDGKYKLVVDRKYRGFINRFIELAPTDEMKQMYKNMYYIPSFWEPITDPLKKYVWYPARDSISLWWKNSDLNKIIVEPINEFREKAKNGWNRIFNRKEYLSQKDIPQKAGVWSEYMYTHFGEVRKQAFENFDEIRAPLEDLTGKVFNTIDDVSDEDLFKFIANWKKYYTGLPFAQFRLRGTEVIAQSYETVGTVMMRKADKIKAATTTSLEVDNIYNDFYSIFRKSEDDLTSADIGNLRLMFMEGHADTIDSALLSDIDVKTIYGDARAYVIKNDLLDKNSLLDNLGNFRRNYFAAKVDKVKGEMFSGILRRYEFKNYDEFSKAFLSYSTRPVVTGSAAEGLEGLTLDIAVPWVKKTVMLDMARFGIGPFAQYSFIPNTYSTQESLRRASEVMEGGCAENSICKLERGTPTGPTESATAYLLDRAVPDEIDVKLWRQKPDSLTRMPIYLSTALFYTSVPEHPRFHLISPCYGIAKIWKSGDTVFVNIEKTKKCDVGDPMCDSDTPNYCYADEELIWGQDAYNKGNMINTGDAPSEWLYWGSFAGCTIGCTILSQGAGAKSCLKGCGYAAIAGLFAQSTASTLAYEGSSWTRQRTGWGYWNYQKAGDICDTIELASSLGGWKLPTGGQAQNKFFKGIQSLSKTVKGSKATQTVSKYTGKLGFGIGDICFGLLLIGDSSLSWPIKVPIGQVWRKGTPLTEECMQNAAGECGWVEKQV